MILHQNTSIKKKCLWPLIVACFMVAVLLVFISIISMRTGFLHMQQDGFWVPVSAGMALLAFAIFFFVCSIRRIISCMKAEELFHP